MKLNDYKCDVCQEIYKDELNPPVCCGEKTRKLYVSYPVVWKTPGCSRTVPFPEKKK